MCYKFINFFGGLIDYNVREMTRRLALNMKTIGLILFVVVGISVLGYGQLHWQAKITAVTEQESQAIEKTLQNDFQEEEKVVFNIDYAANLPHEVIARLSDAQAMGESVDLALIGRDLGEWAQGLEAAIIEVYGSQIWNIEVLAYGNHTTSDLSQDVTLQNLQADVILFEVPLLNNNAAGTEWEVSLFETQRLLSHWSDAVVILQPSNPIFQAVNYPRQVESFMESVDEERVYLINHWQAWPDFNSEEITDYLDEAYYVNEAGAALWQSYLINYFIAK